MAWDEVAVNKDRHNGSKLPGNHVVLILHSSAVPGGDSLTFTTGVPMSSNFLRTPNDQACPFSATQIFQTENEFTET